MTHPFLKHLFLSTFLLGSALIGMEGEEPVNPTATDETPAPKKKSAKMGSGFSCKIESGKCQGTIGIDTKPSFVRFADNISANKRIGIRNPQLLTLGLSGESALEGFTKICSSLLYAVPNAKIAIKDKAKQENADRKFARDAAKLLCNNFGKQLKISTICKEAGVCELKSAFYRVKGNQSSVVMVLSTKGEGGLAYHSYMISLGEAKFTFNSRDLSLKDLAEKHLKPLMSDPENDESFELPAMLSYSEAITASRQAGHFNSASVGAGSTAGDSAEGITGVE